MTAKVVSGPLSFLPWDVPPSAPLRCDLVLSAHVKVFCPSADAVCQPARCLGARPLRRVSVGFYPLVPAGHGQPRGSAAPQGRREQRRRHGLGRGQAAGVAVRPRGGRRGAAGRVGAGRGRGRRRRRRGVSGSRSRGPAGPGARLPLPPGPFALLGPVSVPSPPRPRPPPRVRVCCKETWGAGPGPARRGLASCVSGESREYTLLGSRRFLPSPQSPGPLMRRPHSLQHGTRLSPRPGAAG